MNKNRLEAFSDGVIAIILTIMVLELKVPQDASFETFKHLGAQLLSYVLSFVYVAIYWNNHHHMLHGVKHVNGAALWSNTVLLFFLSLFPFCTAWVGETHAASLPVAFYGGVLLAAAVSYNALAKRLIDLEGPDSVLARASAGGRRKGQVSQLLYASGVICAYWLPLLSFALYSSVALLWLVPSRAIEALLAEEEGRTPAPKARKRPGAF